MDKIMGNLLSAKTVIKIAVVSGDSDGVYTGPLVTMLCRRFEEFGYHILWFHTISDEGSQGTPHEVGEYNIYNLINYDAIDFYGKVRNKKYYVEVK